MRAKQDPFFSLVEIGDIFFLEGEKRKYLVEEKVEEKEEIEKTEDELEPKRIRITTQEEGDEEEEPSFWRGGLIKPLLIAGLASASFFVNTMYKTSVPKAIPPIQQKKKASQQTMPKSQYFMFQNKPLRRSIVPGFTQ